MNLSIIALVIAAILAMPMAIFAFILLIETFGYDKRLDEPKYLCMECSKTKTDKLRAKGIKIRGKSQ